MWLAYSMHQRARLSKAARNRVGGVWRCWTVAVGTLNSGFWILGVFLGMRVNESCPTATFWARALVDNLPRVDSTNQSNNYRYFSYLFQPFSP
ncbi:hypothetical protein M430DRAFT_241923 [Amorphotheca resinae ATCC 22711]|uniref:Uncharacterized protein n=1 Tax=Amorphotheca resinae ATCC 22711 TaxID=857342 RepID=A0A2T3B235_AMORE|nr:hypothetical protein M430DRAFT_241923 [Amorphotheca resinae ATCC 22711]PSS18622.1 hypothetical protein M430DRAFT_241923 [Amorphotheca resinae ATCC 22711]